MIKKTLIVTIVALLLCSMIIPSAVATDNDEIKKTASMENSVTIDFNKPDTPIPIDETKVYNISIKYNISKSGIFSSLLLPFFMDKDIDINIAIVDESTGCTASFADKTLTTKIGDEVKNLTAKLSIKLDETAPALSDGFVKFNVSIEPVKGPFGLITFIDGFEKEFTFEFEPAYLGLIDPDSTEGDFYEIAPFNETVIPIDIKNLGNGKTEVKIEIVNSSDNFDVVIQDKVILRVNENATIDLTIIADNKFDEEEIKLKFTPTYSENLEVTGSSILMTLTLKNDGSYVEEEEDVFELDITLLIVFLIIIIFIVVIIGMLKRRR